MPVRLQDRRRRSGAGRQLWRHLRTAMRLLWRRPLVSVTVIAEMPDGRIALVRRVDSDLWSVPGGIIDWGEDVSSAAERELREEAGLALTAVERLVGVYSAPDRDHRAHAVSIAVLVRCDGEPQIGDPLEVSEIHLFTRDELPLGHLALDSEQQLLDHLAGRTVVA